MVANPDNLQEPEHCVFVFVEKGVSGVGILFDVVGHANSGEETLEFRGYSAVEQVLGAVAGDDGARSSQKILGILRQMTAVVHAGGGESARRRREEQGETSAHAKTDDADLAGAALLLREPGADGFDLVERSSLLLHAIAGNRTQAADLAAPMEEVGRGAEKSFAGQPLGLIAQVGLHPSGVVDDNHSGPGAGSLRLSHVGWKVAPGTRNGDVGHQRFMALYQNPGIRR